MKKYLLISMALATMQMATAESVGAITPKISTMGIGLEYEHPIDNNFSISAGLHGYNYSRSLTQDKVSYDAKLKLRFFTVTGNYYPWDNNFRFSGGLALNNSKLSATARPTGGTYDINGNTYTASQIGSANASVDFNKVAPYIGVGWESGDRKKEGLSFSADLGIMITGKPDVALNVQCGSGVTTTACNRIQRDAEVERGKLQDKVNSFNIYPVISIGATYRF